MKYLSFEKKCYTYFENIVLNMCVHVIVRYELCVDFTNYTVNYFLTVIFGFSFERKYFLPTSHDCFSKSFKWHEWIWYCLLFKSTSLFARINKIISVFVQKWICASVIKRECSVGIIIWSASKVENIFRVNCLWFNDWPCLKERLKKFRFKFVYVFVLCCCVTLYKFSKQRWKMRI